MALFAALSYAVTQSGRGGGGIDREQEELDLAVNEQCIGLVEYGENQLKIFNNCADDQISYELPAGGNPNPLAPSDRSCHVFDDAGAGITPCGSFLDVFGVPIASSIAFGDTMTGVILPGGAVLRCRIFGTQTSGEGRCAEYEYSFDNGFNFFISDSGASDPQRRRICITPPETTAQLRDVFCLAACGSNATGGTNGGGVFPAAANFVNGVIEEGPPTFSCTGQQTNQFDCGCWGSG